MIYKVLYIPALQDLFHQQYQLQSALHFEGCSHVWVMGGGCAIGTRQALFDSPGKAFVGIPLDQPGFHGMGCLLLFLCGLCIELLRQYVVQYINQSQAGFFMHLGWKLNDTGKWWFGRIHPANLNMEHKNGGFRFDDFPLQMGVFFLKFLPLIFSGVMSFQLWRFLCINSIYLS